MDDAALKSLADLTVAPFRARAPWWGGDLQTLSSYLLRGAPLDAQERLILPLDDGTGDRLVAALNRPASPVAGRPLVVLIHGLSGDEASVYMRRTAGHLLTQGYPVLRLNLRGAGPSRPLSRFQYHAGRTADLEMALAALPSTLKANGMAAVGYSLGGNMLLKFLGERGRSSPLGAAISVSAPIDLAATSRRMQKWRNSPYQSFLMREIRLEAVTPASEITAAERRAVLAARSIRDFDEVFSGPRNGYAGADDYYEGNAARNFLGGIAVPTLVIHASDDPWVPADPYFSYRWRDNPALVPLLSPGGGHVGFHGSDRNTVWHDLAIAQFLGAVFSPP
jgi:predicted alpha/beta-fold hydrolase